MAELQGRTLLRQGVGGVIGLRLYELSLLRQGVGEVVGLRLYELSLLQQGLPAQIESFRTKLHRAHQISLDPCSLKYDHPQSREIHAAVLDFV